MNGDEGWGGNNPQPLQSPATATSTTSSCRRRRPTSSGSGRPTSPISRAARRPRRTTQRDAYVDWTGVDGYNWGTSDKNFEWQEFSQVFADIYPTLAAFGKPIFIGEMASDEVGGSKASWIANIVPTLKTTFPMIRGFVWFDIAKERQWQVNSSAAALAAYKTMASDPYLNP